MSLEAAIKLAVREAVAEALAGRVGDDRLVPLREDGGAARTQVWSCGGGVQSAAIAAMICSGELPAPELAVMADTGYERRTTWEYVDGVLRPNLARAGVDLQIAKRSQYATVGLYGKNGDLLIPAYTTAAGGEREGMLRTLCSTEWKKRVVQRWLREQGVKQCDVWIGFSMDEAHRMKPSGQQWYRNVWPLIDRRMRRSHCIQAVLDAGWPEPPRSSCWMCPHHTDGEWRDIEDSGELGKAKALEAAIQARDPHVWLHKSAQPIGDVEFSTQQPGLFDGCEEGYCFV